MWDEEWSTGHGDMSNLQEQFNIKAQLYYRKPVHLYDSVSKKPSHVKEQGRERDWVTRQPGAAILFLGSVLEHFVFE